MFPYISLITLLPQLVSCAVWNVTVGGPGSLVYDPESLEAEVGDTVRFIFKQKNHTVTQSTLENPCQHLQGGFDTGFIPVADSVTDNFPVAQLTVTNKSPIWAYCAQGQHCQLGMVFAVNPGNDFSAFKSAAMGSSTSAPTPNQAPPPPPSGSLSPSSPATGTGNTPPSAAPTNPPVAAPAPSSSPVAVVTVVATVTATNQPKPNAQPTPDPSPLVDYKVIVGGLGSDAFTFQPSHLEANVGDTITFEFHQSNHTVTASSFAKPCQPLSSTSSTGEVGFDSGFMPVQDSMTNNFPTYTIRVNDTQAIWAYCRQGDHCGRGMVFAVNPPADGSDTFNAFQALAQQQGGGSSSSSSHSSPDAATPRAGVVKMLVTPLVVGIIAFLL